MKNCNLNDVDCFKRGSKRRLEVIKLFCFKWLLNKTFDNFNLTGSAIWFNFLKFEVVSQILRCWTEITGYFDRLIDEIN